MQTDFDPYDNLMELNKFAKAADVHLTNLLKNQKEIVTAVNNLSKRIDKVNERLKILEEKNAITREKR